MLITAIISFIKEAKRNPSIVSDWAEMASRGR